MSVELKGMIYFSVQGPVASDRKRALQTLINFSSPCQGGRATTMKSNEGVGRAALSVLNWLATGIVFLDGQGMAMHLNDAALEMVRVSDGLALENGRLVAEGVDLPNILDALARDSESGKPWRSLRLARPSGKPGYLVTLTGVGQAAWREPPAREVRFVVVVDNQEAPTRAQPEILRALFGFTATEARVALAWANGESAVLISRGLGTSLDTVRSHIRSIHTKLGVRRQAQAAQRIINASLCLPGSNRRNA